MERDYPTVVLAGVPESIRPCWRLLALPKRENLPLQFGVSPATLRNWTKTTVVEMGRAKRIIWFRFLSVVILIIQVKISPSVWSILEVIRQLRVTVRLHVLLRLPVS